MDDHLDSLPRPPHIRTGRGTAAHAAPPQDVGGGASGAYQIPAHVPPAFLVSSAELYDSPKPVTQAYQRSGYNTSTGGSAGHSAAGGGAGAGGGVTTRSKAGGKSAPHSGSGGGLPLSSSGPLASAGGSLAQGRQPMAWGKRTPLRKDASWFALSVLLLYVAAVVYYLYVRIAFTLDMRDRWYSIMVLVVECIGISAVIPYAVLNVVHTHPSSSPGLPADDGSMQPDKTFTVRVFVPCYAEALAVVSATVTAAMEADLPPGVSRELYLCDDGKDVTKRAWLEGAYGEGSGNAHRGRVHYVSGRTRHKGEINGKSANLNNALKSLAYQQFAGNPSQIPLGELVVVFDADMQAKRHLFCKLLEVMLDDEVALCLSPQAFSNVDAATDVFNNSNEQFWQYVLPGLDALGYIACTGTNFVIRARALGSVGWFPEFCITEDYALSMELKAAGYKGAYLAEYLAVGEAPTGLRNVLRQRSRWAKGHMQVFFSGRSPLLRWRLPLGHKLLYTNGTYAYFCAVVTTWTFILVPFVSLMFRLQPVRFGREFALAATLYLLANSAVMNYFHVASHLRGHWMASVSNYLLSFTYAKAITNTLLAKLHIKKKAGFKPTDKTTGGGAAATATQQIQAALMTRLTSITRRFNAATLPQLYEPPAAPPAAAAAKKKEKEEAVIPDKLVMSLCLSLCLHTIVLGLHQGYVQGRLTGWLLLPMLWATYNAVPPVLFFGYVFAQDSQLFVNLCFWLQLVSMASALAAIVCLWFVVPVVY